MEEEEEGGWSTRSTDVEELKTGNGEIGGPECTPAPNGTAQTEDSVKRRAKRQNVR